MKRNILQKTMMEMTWCQVEALAKKDAVVLLPVGVVEEHGRHLPLATDIYLAIDQAEAIAEEMEKAGFPCIIAPPFYWGIISVVVKNFPGSFTSKEETVVASLHDLLSSLEASGFTRVVSINAHGDPKHRIAIANAFKRFNQTHHLKARWLTFEDDLKREGFDKTQDYVLSLPAIDFDEVIRFEKEPVDNFDIHAGAYETALMRDSFPELVDMSIAKTLEATMIHGEGVKKWNSADAANKDVVPDGHAGDPAFSQYLSTNMKETNIEMAHGIIDFYKNLEAKN